MTRTEYEAKLKAIRDTQHNHDMQYIHNHGKPSMLDPLESPRHYEYLHKLSKVKDEYIASLEAENERLTKAVEKAVQKLMNACPTDAYPCPIQLEGESLYKRCDRCWRKYLMGDE